MIALRILECPYKDWRLYRVVERLDLLTLYCKVIDGEYSVKENRQPANRETRTSFLSTSGQVIFRFERCKEPHTRRHSQLLPALS